MIPFNIKVLLTARRVWRYQRGNHNPYIEEQTTQWPKEKVQKDKQRSTKYTFLWTNLHCKIEAVWVCITFARNYVPLLLS